MTETTKGTRREVTLPATTVVELLGLARHAGDDALRSHGRNAGRILAERLITSQGGAAAVRALPVATFWKRVSEIFSARGWGTLTHEPAGSGVGELASTDWIEADRGGDGRCTFTAGVIEGLLADVAGGAFAVEEIECRAAGGSACRFRFGSAAALAASRGAVGVARSA